MNFGGAARIWSSSVARRSLMGNERTNNPTPAAARLLGKKRVRRAKKVLKRRGRKRAHRGNPLPAVVGLLGGAGGLLGKLGGRFRAPSEVRARRVVESVVQAANAGNLTAAAGLIERATSNIVGIAKERAVWIEAANRLSPAIIAAVKANVKNIPKANQRNPEEFAASVLGNPVTVPGTGTGSSMSALEQFAGALGQPGTIRAIASAAKPRRSRRQRYPTYTDRYGRQRYSTKPPGSELRLPAGATPSPDTAYSFFRGAVGKGGAAKTAAQFGIAAAAGAAAYFGTQAILKHFGGKAVRQEEAGVKLALAARDARKEYALTHGLRGAAPTYGVPASVIREIGAGMKQQLAELGYNSQGVRTRSASERFLADYAPEED